MDIDLPDHSLLRVPATGPSFYCDNNVHRLGRSLRMLGYNTLYYGEGPDDELRRLRDETGRFLLSRDSDFLGEENSFVVSSDFHLDQLREVVLHLKLDIVSHRYSLCLECNQAIVTVDVLDYQREVPDWVVREQKALWRCSDCGKLYWVGSHLRRMDERFDGLLDEVP